MLLWIKKYAIIGIGLLAGALMIVVKILTSQNSALRRKVETVEAKVHHAKVVTENQVKTEAHQKSRKAEIAKEIEEKKTSSELSRPNDDW